MSNNSTTSPALQSEAESAVHLLDDCFDPSEAGLRERVREFIQAMIREAALVRPRYGRRPKADATNGNVFGDADSRQHERAGAESDRRRWQRCVLMKQNHPLQRSPAGNISLRPPATCDCRKRCCHGASTERLWPPWTGKPGECRRKWLHCAIFAECTFIDERGAVGIRLEQQPRSLRQYGDQFRAQRRKPVRRPSKPQPLL